MIEVVVVLVLFSFAVVYASMVLSSAHDIETERRINQFSVYHKQDE